MRDKEKWEKRGQREKNEAGSWGKKKENVVEKLTTNIKLQEHKK